MTTVTARGSKAGDAEVWLSVHEASAMLGVSPATLRRWSAAGEVEAFTTPGGHRRFALSTLRALLPRPSDAPLRLSVSGAATDRMVRVLRRHARSACSESAWIRRLDAESLQTLRQLSRLMVQGVVSSLDATTCAGRRDALSSAEDAATQLTRVAMRHGGGLLDVTEIFLRFRSLLVHELGDVAVRRGVSTAEATDLVARGGEAVDRLLTAVVAELSAQQGSLLLG